MRSAKKLVSDLNMDTKTIRKTCSQLGLFSCAPMLPTLVCLNPDQLSTSAWFAMPVVTPLDIGILGSTCTIPRPSVDPLRGLLRVGGLFYQKASPQIWQVLQPCFEICEHVDLFYFLLLFDSFIKAG